MRSSLMLLCVLTLGAVLPWTSPCAAERAADVRLPAGPPADRFRELLQAMHSSDRAVLAKHAEGAFAPSMMRPDDSILDFLLGQVQMSGGFVVRRVLQSADRQITVLVQGKQKPDVWLRYVVGVEPEAPHRVNGIFTYRASAAMAGEPDGPVPAEQLPARFAELVDRIAAEGRFSGSVCLMRNGEALVSRAWGEADREAHTPNSDTTRFGIASVGKMFTAVAIAQLAEAGKLQIEDRAAKFVPGWLPPGAESVTIAQLLTHTSGLGDYLGGVVNDRSGRSFDALEDYRRFAVESPIAFAPGSAFQYSNTGYVVLGAILEKVSGLPWHDWVNDRVLAAAGMTHSDAKRDGHRPRGPIATGYHLSEEGVWGRTDTLRAGNGTPAGGGEATAKDLARFGTALFEGRLVTPAMLARMTEPRVAMAGTGKQYGYGTEIVSGREGRSIFGHEGGFPGVGASLEVYLPEGYVLAVLSNTTGGAAPVADAWRDLLLRSIAPAAKP
ncbi:MAG: beta-lactamase family protein [Candidatus Eisenbacteria bacterium]|nr:beta-lactamase family protein [Candidatus Eisenbacteria bacterium]